MKSFNYASVFILSILMFTFSACDDEPLEGQFDTGGGGGGGATTCLEATNNVGDATTAFSTVTPSDANYTTVCNDYVNALEDFIALCGDSTGTVQGLIDGLDCTSDAPDDCPSAQAATNSAETAYNADTTNAGLCNAYINALENEIAICGDDGSLQGIVDGLSCGSGTADGHALMTANLDGVQYDNMKPNGYNTFPIAISVVTFSSWNDEDYIKIQGNSTYTSIIPNDTTKEINLFIPQNAWEEGTYDLEFTPDSGSSGAVLPHYDINFFYEGNVNGYEDNSTLGSLTITNFDLANRVITGTFEFNYIKINNDTDEETGPFQCMNGTFDYSLDDSYFD